PPAAAATAAWVGALERGRGMGVLPGGDNFHYFATDSHQNEQCYEIVTAEGLSVTPLRLAVCMSVKRTLCFATCAVTVDGAFGPDNVVGGPCTARIWEEAP
ncbi:MAG: hypothetical protein Q605_AUC00120G0002, partial [Actinomyces urogenitalis DORA_12]